MLDTFIFVYMVFLVPAVLVLLELIARQRAKRAWQWGVLNGIQLCRGDKVLPTPYGDAAKYCDETGIIPAVLAVRMKGE